MLTKKVLKHIELGKPLQLITSQRLNTDPKIKK